MRGLGPDQLAQHLVGEQHAHTEQGANQIEQCLPGQASLEVGGRVWGGAGRAMYVVKVGSQPGLAEMREEEGKGGMQM